jgi:hypothetical protein
VSHSRYFVVKNDIQTLIMKAGVVIIDADDCLDEMPGYSFNQSINLEPDSPPTEKSQLSILESINNTRYYEANLPPCTILV